MRTSRASGSANFFAFYNGWFQAKIAEANGGNYAYALALAGGVVDHRDLPEPGATRRALHAH
jgi:hypothetical protein